MCNTNAEPEQHCVPVHGCYGFLVSGSSGHPHPGHKGPVNEEAISLPSSAQSSPQTPHEGLGKEEDMSGHLLSSSLTGSCEITQCASARSLMAVVSQRRWSWKEYTSKINIQCFIAGRAGLRWGKRMGSAARTSCYRDTLWLGIFHQTLPRCLMDFNAILVKQSEKQYNWYYQLIHPQCWRRGLLEKK